MAADDQRVNKRFVSFDGGVTADSAICIPSDCSATSLQKLELGRLQGAPRIARGSGLSFVAASFGQNTTSVDMTSFKSILAYDKKNESVEVESGATMGDIYNYLLTLGRYLPVQPGFPTITAGGCIAVDVHGKNQYADGNFSSFIESIKLMHPAHGEIELSSIDDPLFQLTVGGYGLTGYILSAKIKTRALTGTLMEMVHEPIDKFDDTPDLLKRAATSFDSTVSWHDLSLRGKNFGRGFLLNARFIEGSSGPALLEPAVYVDSDSRRAFAAGLYSTPLIGVINSLYGGLKRFSGPTRPVPLHQCLYPSPLMRNIYFKLFGATGFHEYQLIIAPEKFELYTQALRQWLQNSNLPITLASAKYFDGEPRDLRFCGRGICFALNFPRSPEGDKFMTFLDQLAIKHNLLPYIAKDSRLPLSVVKHCYPDYQSFKERLINYDPARLFRSELSLRLEL